LPHASRRADDTNPDHCGEASPTRTGDLVAGAELVVELVFEAHGYRVVDSGLT
jgi:hypothetical protein